MLKEDEKILDNEINSSNIFEWFEGNLSLDKEVKNIKESEKKDIFYYLSFFWRAFEILFFCLLFVFLLCLLYINIQKNDTVINSTTLDPFCQLILWDLNNKYDYCYSVYALNKEYNKDYNKLINYQVSKILEIVWDVYEVDNFTKSKEVDFLINETKTKVRPLKVIEKFDNLKRGFHIDKDIIRCNNFLIKSNNILSADCEASSTFYERILWFDWTNNYMVEWTSISIASSFLNYIERKSSDFILINKQKLFTSKSIVWDNWWFNNKTHFKLELQYLNNNLLN